MPEVLLISENYVKKYTTVNGSLDPNLLYPSIYLAQDKWLLPFLGTDLLNKIKADVAAGTTATGTFASATGGTGVHRASENGNGGLLNPEQSARFLDYMFDATVIGKVARTVRMRADTTEIDRMSVGEKLMKLATEGDDTAANSAVTFSKISLSTKKLRLDWELSTESLEDNIEGADLEDHIARMMATQAGNDICY